MKNRHLLLLLCTCSFFGMANEVSTEKTGLGQKSLISVEQAYIRSSIPGTTITSLYMIIENKGEKTVTLLEANSKISPRIEIHQHSMSDGMMRMRQLDSIEIKARQRIVLQPSGLHLMLFDVKKPLKAQQNVELTLSFFHNPSVTIQVPVLSPLQEKIAQEAYSTAQPAHHHH
ncbi:MAG TPA: copper chaperone PCu(A)C [Colwellia sp.]|nr:copper chaperone PCu(A)C [Colwellia sp.]